MEELETKQIDVKTTASTGDGQPEAKTAGAASVAKPAKKEAAKPVAKTAAKAKDNAKNNSKSAATKSTKAAAKTEKTTTSAKGAGADKYAVASLKMVKGSPLKVRSVTNMVVGKPAQKAAVLLKFCAKRVAKDVRELLKSAMANAENNHDMDIDALVVDHIEVGKSMLLKRMRPRAKGRGVRVRKHFSNIKVYLVEQN